MGTASLIFDGLATGLGVFGASASAKGQSDQFLYQAQVAANNAAIVRENAKLASMAGQYEESAAKTSTGRLVADQKAAQAANGLDVDIGTPAAVRESTASLGAMDAAVIHFNAAREAYGLESEAANLDTQSSMYKQAAKGAKKVGAAKVAATLLSGATSLSSKWNSYKQSGVVK